MIGVFDSETGQPVAGVELIDPRSGAKTVTRQQGTARLAFLPEGSTSVTIRKLGYKALTVLVTISPADTVPLTVALDRLVKLDTVVSRDSTARTISPALRGFEERRLAHNGGHFITAEQLRQSEGRPLQNVIREVPGVIIRCAKRSTQDHLAGDCWAVSGRAPSRLAILGGECIVDLYIDGTPVYDNNLNRLKVSDFGGVEYYAGGASIPAQYNKTGSACGVLLLWTRER